MNDILVLDKLSVCDDKRVLLKDVSLSLKENERLIPFGSVFPHAPDALEELERIRDMGLVGVKFHPDYQGFFVDDEKMKPIYRKISQLGLITVFHAGKDYGYSMRDSYIKPLLNDQY